MYTHRLVQPLVGTLLGKSDFLVCSWIAHKIIIKIENNNLTSAATDIAKMVSWNYCAS